MVPPIVARRCRSVPRAYTLPLGFFSREPTLVPATDSVRAQQTEGPFIGPSFVVAIEDLLKQRVGGRNGGEKRHRGPQLEIVGRSHDSMRRFTVNLQERRATLRQSWPQHGMSEVGAGLLTRSDGIFLRHRAGPESGELRKNEPHPVRRLASALKLPKRVGKRRCLGSFKPGEVKGITHLAKVQLSLRLPSNRQAVCHRKRLCAGMLRLETRPKNSRNRAIRARTHGRNFRIFCGRSSVTGCPVRIYLVCTSLPRAAFSTAESRDPPA